MTTHDSTPSQNLVPIRKVRKAVLPAAGLGSHESSFYQALAFIPLPVRGRADSASTVRHSDRKPLFTTARSPANRNAPASFSDCSGKGIWGRCFPLCLTAGSRGQSRTAAKGTFKPAISTLSGLRDLSPRVNAPSPTRPVPIPRTIFARIGALWARPRETSTHALDRCRRLPPIASAGWRGYPCVFERVYSLAEEAVAEVSTGRSECLLQSSQEPSKSLASYPRYRATK